MKTTTTILTLIFIFYAAGYAQTSQKYMFDETKFMNLQGYMGGPTEELINKNKKENFPFYSNTPENIKFETASSGTSLLDSTIGQIYDAISKNWINSYKTANYYDNYGHNILSIYCRLNDSTGQWISISKTEQTYNENGKRILLLSSIWDESDSLWINDSKIETKWGPNMEWAQGISFKWDKMIGQWDSSLRTNGYYDHNGNLSLYQSYKRNQNANKWVNNWKEEYTYDSKGNNIKLCTFSWDVNNSQWDSAFKIITAYDSFGKKTRELHFQMSYDPGMATCATLYEFAYDNNGNLIQQLITYDLDENSDQWVHYKRVTTRDDYGNGIQYSEYQLNTTSDAWILLSFDNNVYDAHGNITQQTSYNIYGNDTVPSNKSFWYYSELLTSDGYGLNREHALRLYPNPASGYFYLITDSPEVKSMLMLFDVQGRLLINQVIDGATPVSTERLQKGMYIYRISENKKIYTGKLIVQ